VFQSGPFASLRSLALCRQSRKTLRRAAVFGRVLRAKGGLLQSGLDLMIAFHDC